MNDLTPEPPSNVVALNGEAANRLEILRKAREAKHACLGVHKRIVVDSDTRTIECEVCGRTVDAFDYLEQWAAEGDKRMSELERIKIQTRLASAELQDLGHKIANVRTQLKRRGHPQPKEERAEFNTARWNLHSQQTADLLAKHHK